MYKHQLSTWGALLKFFPLFRKTLGTFIVYGLFVFVLLIATFIAVLFFILATCCIALVLIIIPVVGAILMLPISYTFRAFSIEFLGQFGEDFLLLPENKELVADLP